MDMELTDEQRRVVEIDAGSHLVLAPPGSGKTEILSQRILHAMRTGVNPERMLCATFTNRAAFEMRARVEAHCQEAAMPEVGNLHHFCFRFLCSVKRLWGMSGGVRPSREPQPILSVWERLMRQPMRKRYAP